MLSLLKTLGDNQLHWISDLAMILTLKNSSYLATLCKPKRFALQKDWKVNGKFTQCTRRFSNFTTLIIFDSGDFKSYPRVHLHHLNSNRLGKSVLLSQFARLQLHRFLSATHDSMIVCFFNVCKGLQRGGMGSTVFYHTPLLNSSSFYASRAWL